MTTRPDVTGAASSTADQSGTRMLHDQAARDRIAHATDATLFVNAGAGSGKTRSLVHRIRHLVLHDGVALAHVAAVTFTEKAGAELRDRLRADLEQAWQHGSGAHREAAARALEDLDGAAIGTLHSFAQRILLEHPIEAGLPPLLEVLDEVGSSVAFEDRWRELQRALLDDDEIAEPLLLGLTLGITFDQVRALVRALDADWDLIADRVLVGDPEPVVLPDLATWQAMVRSAVDLGASCTDPGDRLLARLHQLQVLVQRVTEATDLESRTLALAAVAALRTKLGNTGRKGSWPDIQQVKDAYIDVVQEAGALVARVKGACLRRLTRWAAEHVLEAADSRRREGRLQFHDLLVLARDLLRRHPQVRQRLHERYQRLLLDEFQDTDPIQIELAVRIAAGAAGGAAHWQDVAVPPGRIFVVGDAKQSIYRFRRASIATYLGAQTHLGEPVSLTTNFRTVRPVVEWVNAVFGRLIVADGHQQPAYEELRWHREATGAGPAVTILGAEQHPGAPKVDALRTWEAADVAGVIGQALSEPWQVCDAKTGRWRPARASDIAVLVPSRTSLPYLEDALDGAGVPYRAEASSLVYHASEIRALLACARAVADPTDQLSLLAALRSALFGCGDDDLWAWRQAGGSIRIYSEVEGGSGPVADALAYLRRLHHRSRWMTPSELLAAIVADRRMYELAGSGPRSRDAWRRLRFVVDQARAWAQTSRGGLRAYLDWAAQQGQDTTRVAESVLPETDLDTVRVLTIHAAKGLEFPIVVLSGTSARPNRPRGVRLLWPAGGGYEVRFSAQMATEDFAAAAPVDESMDEQEKRRLLYVAATRARDHLVVSLHRGEKPESEIAARWIAEADGAAAAGAVPFRGEGVEAPPAAPVPVAPPPEWQEWLAGVQAAREASAVVPAQSASGLEGTEPEVVLAADPEPQDGEAKGVRDLMLPAWSKGRYGSAVGRAVHGVLQVLDLASGAGLEDGVAAQCVAEGVTGQEELVAALVRSALGSEVVQRAAVREHWREVYVGTVATDGALRTEDGAELAGAGQVLEGYVDLVYREDDGSLVVVDYKTDAVRAAALGARAGYYRAQVEAYRRCLGDATGAKVAGVLLFLHPEAAAVPAPVG